MVRKQRWKSRPFSSQRLSGARSISILSPTAEEKIQEEEETPEKAGQARESSSSSSVSSNKHGSADLGQKATKRHTDIYSPSSSSGDGNWPTGMLPFKSAKGMSPSLDSFRKENKQPTPRDPVLSQAEFPNADESPHRFNRQQQHFMSSPAFPKQTPPVKSRKKGKLLKDSPKLLGSAKSSSRGRNKLHKQSSSSGENQPSNHADHLSRLQNEGEPEADEIADFVAETKDYVADSSELDARWKRYQADPTQFPALDAEKVVLDARFVALKSKATRLSASWAGTRPDLELASSIFQQHSLGNIASDSPSEIQGYRQGNAEPRSPLRLNPFDGNLGVSTTKAPEITVSSASAGTAASSADHVKNDARLSRSKSPRRIGGSEPGLQPRPHSHSPRRISRSLYDHPKRKKNILKLSSPRDPLSRVSRADDDASLAILAQALVSTETNESNDKARKADNVKTHTESNVDLPAGNKVESDPGISPVKNLGHEKSPSIQSSHPNTAKADVGQGQSGRVESERPAASVVLSSTPHLRLWYRRKIHHRFDKILNTGITSLFRIRRPPSVALSQCHAILL